MKRCKVCILPEGYPGISFNAEGICNFCLDHKEYRRSLGRDRLVEIVNSAKKKGKYDCVIPLSGGKDSTYILYYTVKELKLRPIAVHYDSGYQSEISKRNIETACRKLDTPIIIKRPNSNIQKKVLKEGLLISEIVGSFTSRTCGNCEVLLRTVSLNTAREYDVPFVFWGSSPLESLDNKDYEGYRYGRNILEGIASRISRFIELKLTPVKLIRVIPRLLRYNIFSILQRIEMKVPLRYAFHPTKVFPFPADNPKFIHFFDYITWNSAKGVKLLEKELDWKRPEEKFSRFDCLLHCFGNHHHLQLRRITDDGKTYCNFIRENKIYREDALALEESLKGSVKEECECIIKGLGLTKYKIPRIKGLD